MTKMQQQNNPRTGYLAEIIILISGLLVIFEPCCGLLLKNYLYHGVSGIARCKKRAISVADALLPIIAISILIGASFLSFAVRSMA